MSDTPTETAVAGGALTRAISGIMLRIAGFSKPRPGALLLVGIFLLLVCGFHVKTPEIELEPLAHAPEALLRTIAALGLLLSGTGAALLLWPPLRESRVGQFASVVFVLALAVLGVTFVISQDNDGDRNPIPEWGFDPLTSQAFMVIDRDDVDMLSSERMLLAATRSSGESDAVERFDCHRPPPWRSGTATVRPTFHCPNVAESLRIGERVYLHLCTIPAGVSVEGIASIDDLTAAGGRVVDTRWVQVGIKELGANTLAWGYRQLSPSQRAAFHDMIPQHDR